MGAVMPETQTTTTTETHVQSDAIKVAVMSNEMVHIRAALERLETTMNIAIQGFVTHDKLADYEDSNRKKHLDQDAAIKKLENWNDWAIKLVLGAVILAVLGLVIIKSNPF